MTTKVFIEMWLGIFGLCVGLLSFVMCLYSAPRLEDIMFWLIIGTTSFATVLTIVSED